MSTAPVGMLQRAQWIGRVSVSGSIPSPTPV
jgi:hypothetical protein